MMLKEYAITISMKGLTLTATYHCMKKATGQIQQTSNTCSKYRPVHKFFVLNPSVRTKGSGLSVMLTHKDVDEGPDQISDCLLAWISQYGHLLEHG